MKPHSEFSKKPQTWTFMLIRSMICQCKPSTGHTLADIVQFFYKAEFLLQLIFFLFHPYLLNIHVPVIYNPLYNEQWISYSCAFIVLFVTKQCPENCSIRNVQELKKFAACSSFVKNCRVFLLIMSIYIRNKRAIIPDFGNEWSSICTYLFQMFTENTCTHAHSKAYLIHERQELSEWRIGS